jgi:hypothetical protein
MDNNGFWPKKENLPILNVGLENFWDSDEVIWEHYFKTSHCFLWEKYDVRYNPAEADVVFTSLWQRESPIGIGTNAPRILLIHEPAPVRRLQAFDSYKAVISFSNCPEQPNNIRIPYWVYRIFDQFATHFGDDSDFNTYFKMSYLHEREEFMIDSRNKFCAVVQGKPVPWRDQVFDWLEEIDHVDYGGSLRFNLPHSAEHDYMKRRLMGRQANDQKYQFFSTRKFAVCMENTMDMKGYTTEKIIDAYFARSIPLYAGQMDPADGFNLNAFINLYDFDTKADFVDAVQKSHEDKGREYTIRQQPLFLGFPEQFTLEGMLDTYSRIIEK